MFYLDLPFRYLPAMLSAKEGKIINTFIKRSRISSWVKWESGWSGPEAVSTTNIPTAPNAREAQINIRVAIFCIILV